MNQEDKDKLTTKAFKVIKSCKTIDQLIVASDYCYMVVERIPFSSVDEEMDLKELFRECTYEKENFLRNSK